MGYRSDVAAAFYVNKPDDFPMLKLWLDENFPTSDWEQNIRWFSKGMLVECDSVKWYDGYPDVQAFEAAADKFIELCNNELNVEDVPKFNYEFIRIGEDYDDVDVVREGARCEYLLEVQRSISVEV